MPDSQTESTALTAELLTKGERSRARIIQAAHRLFVENGYHGTSMRQVAEQSGLALGGIYNHFAGKEEIFAAVVAEQNPYGDMVLALEAAQGRTVEELVHSGAAGMLAALQGRPDSLHLIFIEIVEFGGQHFPPLIDRVLPQMMGFAHRLIQAGGILRPIPLPTLIRAFMGFFFAYYMTEWLFGGQIPSRPRHDIFDDFVDIYLFGVLKQ
jgi:AcrR family transcriptional regulator